MDSRRWKFPNAQITLTGHSRAAEMTAFFLPELNWFLDAGIAQDQEPDKVFITHGHLDHSLMIPKLFNRRSKLDIYAPKDVCPYLAKYLESGRNFNDCGDQLTPEKWSIHEVVPGDTIELGRHKVEIIRCVHTVPSVGFGFYDKRTKIKPEYAGLAGKELAALRKAGVQISGDVFVPLFAYMGDTTIEALQRNPKLFHFPVIIVECTFLAEQDVASCEGTGHIHWNHIKPCIKKHPKVTFVLIHFSLRYKDSYITEFFNTHAADLPNVVAWVDDPQQSRSTLQGPAGPSTASGEAGLVGSSTLLPRPDR